MLLTLSETPALRLKILTDRVRLVFFIFFTCLLDGYTPHVYNKAMIVSFADKETEKIYNQVFSRKLPHDIQRVALRKLILIDKAGCLDDLKVPPGNRLEQLSGDREGQYSIRINDQFRICFREDNNRYYDVEIVDYH